MSVVSLMFFLSVDPKTRFYLGPSSLENCPLKIKKKTISYSKPYGMVLNFE